MSYGTEFPQAELHFRHATQYKESGKLEEALSECESALEIDECFPDALNLKGAILEKLGYDREAIRSYEKAVLFDPDYEEAISNIHLLKAKSEAKEQQSKNGHKFDLVTIATYTAPTEAHLGKAKLETCGISAFLADEYMVTMNWLYSTAVGGVKLQVSRKNVSQALEILNQEVDQSQFLIDSNGSPEDIPQCPRCHSFSVRYDTFNPSVAFISQLVTLWSGSSTGGIPLPFLKKRWKCNDCSYSWKWGEPLWPKESEVTRYYIRKRIERNRIIKNKSKVFQVEDDKLPTQFYCSICGMDVEEDWHTCPYCGESLDEPSEIEQSSDLTCPYCDEKVDASWRTCPFCGEQLIEIGYTCSNCGIEVEEDWHTCPNCGEPLDDIE